VVTSAVLPGIRNDAIGRSTEHDAEHHLVEVRPVVLRMASLAQAGAGVMRN
jgi:hypothetical protein